ncbi:MAG: hypothetical protein AAGG00_05395 [Cyanobacteria bacterium P01_H01_bin.150]
MNNLDIGFEVITDIAGNNRIEGDANANATAPDEARAIGVENAEFGEIANGFTINLDSDNNLIEGTATAQSTGEAFADGIRNTGVIQGDGFNLLKGDGRSITTGNGETSMSVGINSADGGVIKGGDGNDILDGTADALGVDAVGAFGVLVTDVDTGNNSDNIKGSATAQGFSTTDARGISVGLSDIDDDTLANPEFDIPLAIAGGYTQVGDLVTGSGNDTLSGEARVIVAALDGDEIFFAGANGIVNDGGNLRQLEVLLNSIGKNLSNFSKEDIEQIIDQLDTSTLDTGSGDDVLIADVELNVAQIGMGADSDLEIIGDGIENAGQLFLGDGNDAVNSTVSVRTTVNGAKGFADALDNSSVGIITGLGLEINNRTLFDLGLGDDTFTSNIFATAVNDLSAADGLGNRGVFVAGGGNDTFNLNSVSEFILEEENDAEQQEGIADGWENRSRVFLDDQEGKTSGNDSVTANATAFGEGVLTIAEGIETREFFDAGGGDDFFNLQGIAITGIGALADNLTQAAGLQTEQIDSGEFLLGDGNNAVFGNAIAQSKAVAGLDDDGGLFTPSTFAFGITQMTADANNPSDAGEFLAGDGNDRLYGNAEAVGEEDVASFGLLFSNAHLGDGLNRLRGNATVNSKISAFANGISVGTDDVFLKTNSLDTGYGLGAEAGVLTTGNDDDFIEGIATTNANGQSLIESDSNGILIEVGSSLNTNHGDDTVIGRATASSVGASPIDDFDVLIDGLENLGSFSTGAGNDEIIGEGFTFGDGVDAVSGGIDNGRALVERSEFVPPIFTTGSGADTIVAVAEAQSINSAAITDGLSNVGEFLTETGDDLIIATAISETFGSGNRAIADGIDNRGLLNTGDGEDKIIVDAIASVTDGLALANAIDQNVELGSVIDLGSGDDVILAEASAFSNQNINAIAILGGAIKAGDGADNIRARSNDNSIGLDGGQGFGNVEIDMGSGNDTLFGFGDAIVDGGSGIDTLEFDFSLNEFIFGGGSIISSGDFIEFTFADITYKTTNFERFEFNADFETDIFA